ncbi:MAG: sporulation initiation factor Spo0A C-terminal domain-containing protein [Clostridia bacterium]
MFSEISVLLCDIHEEYFESIKNEYFPTKTMSVCASTNNYRSCIALSAKLLPDVVIFNAIPGDMDYLVAIYKINKLTHNKPKFVLISNLNVDHLKGTGIIDYLIIGPLIEQSFINEIENLKEYSVKSYAFLKNYLNSFLNKMNIPVNTLGINYIVDATIYSYSSDTILSITKNVYTYVAKQFSTSPSCVEKAMRSSIFKAYEKDSDLFYREFNLTTKPSNSVFISLLVHRLNELYNY